MAKAMKKAEVGMKTPSLRKGQYKRLGRLEAKNPERAERVADRMVERKSRVVRGKAMASSKLAKAFSAAPKTMKKGGMAKKK